MIRIAVFGLGSPFGDDRVGWEVAQALARAAPDAAARVAVEIECLDRPGSGLLGRFGKSDSVIVIDAMRSGAAPGSLRVLDAAGIAAVPGSHSSHAFGLAETLALARALDDLPARFVLFGIEIARLDGTGLTPAVAAAVPDAVARIARLVRALRLDSAAVQA